MLYPIYLDEVIVGRMQVVKHGLYLHFQGTCMLEKNQIYKLWCQNNNIWKLLGTPVPEGDRFVMHRCAPAKLFSGEEFRFVLRKQGEEGHKIFYPLVPGEPISWIEDLTYAKFCLQDEKPGVIVTKP